MPEQQRRAILLREWQGLSYREVAAELEVSQSAVETLIFRARRSLAQGLEQPDSIKPRSGRASAARCTCSTSGRSSQHSRRCSWAARPSRRPPPPWPSPQRSEPPRAWRRSWSSRRRPRQPLPWRSSRLPAAAKPRKLLARVGRLVAVAPPRPANRSRLALKRRPPRPPFSPSRSRSSSREVGTRSRAADARADADRGRAHQAHRRGHRSDEGKKDEGQGKEGAPGQQEKSAQAPAEPQPVASGPARKRGVAATRRARATARRRRRSCRRRAPIAVPVEQAKQEQREGPREAQADRGPGSRAGCHAGSPTPVVDAAEPAAAAEVAVARRRRLPRSPRGSVDGKRNGKSSSPSSRPAAPARTLSQRSERFYRCARPGIPVNRPADRVLGGTLMAGGRGESWIFTRLRGAGDRCLALGVGFVALVGMAGPAPAAQNDLRLTPGAVFTQTNTVPNRVAVFQRGADGKLVAAGEVLTGGNGQPAGNPPLGLPFADSAGNVELSSDGDNRRCLFVTNIGSNTVSSFRVRPDGIELADQRPTGGSRPVSLTSNRRGPLSLLLYVLNSDVSAASIQGYFVSVNCALTPIAGSHQLTTAQDWPAGTDRVQLTWDGALRDPAAQRRWSRRPQRLPGRRERRRRGADRLRPRAVSTRTGRRGPSTIS